MNYYEILGVDRGASTDAIERAFRRVARQVHPDVSAGDAERAEERMKQLNEIRDTLTDPLLRAGYDERLRLDAERTAKTAAAPPPRAPRDERPVDRRAADGDGTSAATADARRGSSAGLRLVLAALGAGLVASAIAVSLPRRVSPLHAGTQPTAAPAEPATSSISAAPPAYAVPLRPGDVPRGNDVPQRPFRARRRGVVHIGSSVDDVVRAFGAPDRVETGARAGDATFHYGKLRLEIENGRVTGGDAAAR